MIRMAKEAGWQYAHGDSGYEPLWEFAALVASAERERLATKFMEMHEAQKHNNNYWHFAARKIREEV